MILKFTRRAVGVAVVTALALVLAACRSNNNKTASNHNEQDVTFAINMIPHHAQAIAMAKLAATRSSTPEVKTLAAQVEKAQQPEINTMNRWLRSWNQPEVDASAAMNMNHSAHASDMVGMMTADELSGMQKTMGPAFDRMFLEGMIKHHTGAIAMARTEQAKGQFPEAKSMAGAIITSQQTEVDQMKKMLL